MSTDLRSELARARSLAPASEVDLASLARARDRRARARKGGTMTLALAVGLAAVVGALTVARTRPGAEAGAAGGPSVELPTPRGLVMPVGSYLYRRVAMYRSEGYPLSTTSTWWASDGSGRVRMNAYDDRTFGPGQMVTDTGPLDTLSTDAAVLREQMIERTAPDGASPEPSQEFTPGPGQPDHVTAGMIRSIGNLLHDPNTPPDLSAALFRVAAGLDGVTLTYDAVDPVGRPAIELQVTTEESLHHWWFDPNTQQLLATQDDDGAIEVIEAVGFTRSTRQTTADPSNLGLVRAPLYDPR